MMMFLSCALKAQISVNVNLGSPPPWGPSGYAEARYYYLPDVEAYYDVQTSMFIYNGGGGVWVHRSALPPVNRNYDLYDGYKVVLTDYRGERPYNNFREHRMKYARGYRGAPQHNNHERPGRGPEHHEREHEDHGHENHGNENHGNGHGHDEGHGEHGKQAVPLKERLSDLS